MKGKIKKLVESETGIEDLSTKSRKQSIVEARVVYSVLCLRHTNDSYERVAKLINRDHSTIVHHRKIYRTWAEYPKMYLNNLSLLDKINDIINNLKTPEEKDIDIITRYRNRNIILSKQILNLRLTIQEQKENIIRLEQYQPVR
tara:strand:+ start:787 stop:1218 length:432 start_codon:yes stop_codon:yes gene_type:complete